MKKIYRSIVTAAFLITASLVQSNAQVTADLVLTGGPNTAVYPGFVTTGTFNVTFTNGSGNTLAAQSFMIVLSLPTGIEFDATYPACPAGWQYTVQPGNLSVNLKPLVPISGLPPTGIVSFSVPFKTMQTVSSQPYLGQIQTLLPVYTDPDNTNNTPAGTVSVLNLPLPVSFEQFTAEAKGCSTAISWTTGQERNNKYFSVDRSLDGIHFESIATIEPKGTHTTGSTYRFTDKEPLNGKNFYRITQFDTDGRSTTSSTLAVSFNCDDGKIELYPNPATEMVQIKGLTGKNTVKVFNAVGQLMVEETTENSVHTLKLSALASGVYQVQVSRNAVVIFNSKLIRDAK